MLFLLNSFHIGPQDKLDLAFEARRPEKKKAFLSVLFLQPQQAVRNLKVCDGKRFYCKADRYSIYLKLLFTNFGIFGVDLATT